MTSDADLPWDPRALEVAARERLSPEAAAYYEATAGHPPVCRDNERAWQSWRFVPRVGVDVSSVSTATEFLGVVTPAPVLLAPCAYAGHAHPEGEIAVARAAGRTGAVYVVSSASTQPPDAIAATTSAPAWFQLYVPRDESDLGSLLRHLETAGYTAVVVTMDAPVGALRHRGAIPEPVEPDLFAFASPAGPTNPAGPLNPRVTWLTVRDISQATTLPVLVKGILRADDAALARDHGASGVIVSNHGGRQLDGVVPTATVVGDVASAVADELLVLVDGGVRSGRDVFRALCLGAHGVLIGRPYLWALAVGGEDCVVLLLERMRLELLNALALTGCTRVGEASPDRLARMPA
jgi:4-hydroxymandelate oxidase